jgi:vacuolar-type H+-ATPase subunit H
MPERDDEYVTQRELRELHDHWRELREADQHAMTVKESADQKALALAREHQLYRDEQANQLREQISEERGQYATRSALDAAVARLDAELKPILSYIDSRRGHSEGISTTAAVLMGIVTTIAVAVSALSTVLLLTGR